MTSDAHTYADAEGRFEGKVALVTGAAGGIGRASAMRLASEGAAVLVVDLDEAGAARTADEIATAGGVASAMGVDVADEGQVAAMVAAAVERHGGLHLAHNNAGINDAATPLHELSLTSWQRMIDVNLTSVFLCMKHEIAHMLDHGGGAIVNTASGAAVVPAPGLPHYTAAKRGVAGLTAAAAQEYNGRGIRVNGVAPGMVDTPMIESWFGGDRGTMDAIARHLPGGHMGSPDDVGDVVAFLCSNDARWLSGETIVVDGGGICR